jgi:hypothetical protein
VEKAKKMKLLLEITGTTWHRAEKRNNGQQETVATSAQASYMFVLSVSLGLERGR